jgi:hypothetical protein
MAPDYLVLGDVAGRTVEVSGPGHDIWGLLDDWVTEKDVSVALAHQYGADEKLVSRDVHALLTELHGHGYVDRDD